MLSPFLLQIYWCKFKAGLLKLNVSTALISTSVFLPQLENFVCEGDVREVLVFASSALVEFDLDTELLNT